MTVLGFALLALAPCSRTGVSSMTAHPAPTPRPPQADILVSILIPARNEAHNIGPHSMPPSPALAYLWRFW